MKTRFLLPLFLSFLLVLPIVAAEKGVGIMWATQSEIVKEGQSNCISYSVYNPFSESASIYLSATGELTQFVVDTQPITVPAGTTHDKAIPVSLCFNIPTVYEKSCTAGIVCGRDCTEPQVSYAGEVVAAEQTAGETGAGTAGSATRAVASAPLTLKVACEPQAKNWTPVFVIAIVLVLLLGLVALRMRKR